MAAYDAQTWSDLFVAGAGAAAALAGLVFVAVSINVERILALDGVPERALATVLLLLSVVFVCLIGLIPAQSRQALGAELLAESLVIGGAIAILTTKSLPRATEPRSWRISRIAVIAVGTVPLVVGGATVVAGAGGGLYWIVAGIVFAIGGGVANAWVLLVEILR